jgi:putative nucleotidyltransferase with HDIG domain
MSDLTRGAAGGRAAAVERQLGSTLALPSLPSIVTKLTELCADPGTGLSDVAALVACDPPLCARTLGLVNSAYVGLRAPVLTIEHATAVLGMDALQNLVLQASLNDLFEHLNQRSDFDVGGLWRHSILTGRIAHELSPRARSGIDEDELELAGLLHDIGKFVLLDLERGAYVNLVSRAATEQRPLWQVEREVLGYDHTEIGAMLARRWKLPESVGRCIELHHRVDDFHALREPGVAAMVLADRLAERVKDHPGQPPRDLLSFLPARVAVHLRLQPGEVRHLAEYAQGVLERLAL